MDIKKMNFTYCPGGSALPPPNSMVRKICEGSSSSEHLNDMLASYICPSLVMMSVINETERSRSDSVGFILCSNGECSLVVGPSGFLYELDPAGTGPREMMKKGKVVVTMADLTLPEWDVHESDIATVLSVDFQFGLVFLKYKNPYHIGEAEVGSFGTILQSEGKRMICLDLHRSVRKFVPRLYTLITDGVECSCTYGHEDDRCYDYMHVKWFDPYLPAVVLDQSAHIVGFKVGACTLDKSLCHIVQIDHLQGLLTGNLSFLDRDIRFLADESVECSTNPHSPDQLVQGEGAESWKLSESEDLY